MVYDTLHIKNQRGDANTMWPCMSATGPGEIHLCINATYAPILSDNLDPFIAKYQD